MCPGHPRGRCAGPLGAAVANARAAPSDHARSLTTAVSETIILTNRKPDRTVRPGDANAMGGAFMFLLKSCPRCRGDLNVSLEGELVCLQCGHEVPRDLAETWS